MIFSAILIFWQQNGEHLMVSVDNFTISRLPASSQTARVIAWLLSGKDKFFAYPYLEWGFLSVNLTLMRWIRKMLFLLFLNWNQIWVKVKVGFYSGLTIYRTFFCKYNKFICHASWNYLRVWKDICDCFGFNSLLKVLFLVHSS